MIRPITGAFLSGFSTATAAATWSSPLAYLGIPAPVALMALAGTTAGLIVQPPSTTSRRAMIGLTFAFTVVSIGVAMLLPFIPGFSWAKEAQGFIALVLGFFAQTVIPAAKRRLSHEIADRGAATQPNGSGSP
jgi:hypothetical protein